MSTRYVGTVQRLPISHYIGVPGLPRSATMGSFGPFQERDIGKQVYAIVGSPGCYQMENEEQRDARLARTRHGVG